MNGRYSFSKTLNSKNAIYISYDTVKDEFEMHSHDCYEMVIISEHKGKHIINNDTYDVSRGDVFVFNEKAVHGFVGANELSMYNIAFNKSVFDEHHLDINNIPGYHALFTVETSCEQSDLYKSYIHLNVNTIDRVFDILEQMKREYNTKEEGYETMILSLFFELSIILSREYDKKRPNAGRMHKLAMAIAHIENNLSTVCVSDIVIHTGYTQRHINRLFKEMFNSTPTEYITRKRLEKSRHHLLNSEATVTETANAFGFSDSNYFIKKFKQHYGITPGQFKRMHIY